MSSQQDEVFLLADIGGTHMRLAQAGVTDAEPHHVRKYVCAKFGSVEEVLQDYLQAHPLTGKVTACFAVAAPVSAERAVDEVVMTNRDWRFSVTQLSQRFGWQSLTVINDFEAVALSVPGLHESQVVQLGGKSANPQGCIAVLGPGTGLGVKHLVATERGYKVLSGEGGHVDFAPVDEIDQLVWQFVRERKGRVSLEDVLSGRGLVNLYQALAAERGVDAGLRDAHSIVFEAQNAACELSGESLQQFCRILGSFAGNLALTLNTTGGVYICGGVVSELADLLESSDFRARFEDKGRFRDYVQDIPVFLITAPEPGLRGALAWLQG